MILIFTFMLMSMSPCQNQSMAMTLFYSALRSHICRGGGQEQTSLRREGLRLIPKLHKVCTYRHGFALETAAFPFPVMAKNDDAARRP
jgi:hypothetical protein